MAELDSILKKFVSRPVKDGGSLQGVAFVVKDRSDATLYSNAAGKLNFESDSAEFTGDSVQWIASMTKLITAVSVLQLVQKKLVTLDDDLGSILPELTNKEILTGFADDGSAILVKQTKPITLRNLLSHSSGFAYDSFDPGLLKWSASIGRTISGEWNRREEYTYPLVFEPGESWTYGIGLDWAGQVVEALTNSTLGAYMQSNIFEPLGMSSTTFNIGERPQLTPRRAAMCFRSAPRESLSLGKSPLSDTPAIHAGGSGLHSTPNDYSKLLSSILCNDGKLLAKEWIQELFKPQLTNPQALQAFFDNPLFHDSICPEFPIGLPVNFSLGGAINLEDVPGKRRKGSMMWSGLTNPHWWVDTETGIAATLFTQILPLGDTVVAELYDELEREVYRTLVGGK